MGAMKAVAIYSEELLEAAVRYVDFGWSVIPIVGNKRPMVAWSEYMRRRPIQAELEAWFSWENAERLEGIAVICGPVSENLTIRDFDSLAAYRRWVASHPAESLSLPTVRTARGYHVYFTSDHGRVEKLGDGELRGGRGYCLLPPSRHPSGAIYEWVNEPAWDALIPAGNPMEFDGRQEADRLPRT